MDIEKDLRSLKNIELYYNTMKKLTIDPSQLNYNEKTFLLACALSFIRQYEYDKRRTSFIELAYYIILKYSLNFKDYEPLYDFSVNVGFYPIAQAITNDNMIQFSSISSSLISTRIAVEFEHKSVIETREQNLIRNKILESSYNEISYVAPTSFGKSEIIMEHIEKNLRAHSRIAIIVPSKSLLMQTYRLTREKNFSSKLIIHDEMYNGEPCFIAILTQERALRLLDKEKDISFDYLYIDEAHRLLENDSRAVLLCRLIKLNRIRNEKSTTIYLSPLIADSNNLKIDKLSNIFEQKIKFNIKEPEYFLYKSSGEIYKYNRFINEFFLVGKETDTFSYICNHASNKAFCYLRAPKKIELFANALSKHISTYSESPLLNEMIDILKRYVHEDFYAIDYLKNGIVYLHAKIPDNIKEYLEYKFSQIDEIRFIIANTVILEGVNLPITSLFILDGSHLQKNDLINLIGRVNRLNQIFKRSVDLNLLLPKIHFVDSEEYYRKNGNLAYKLTLLKSSVSEDKIKNPLLYHFNKARISANDTGKCKKIIENEKVFFDSSKGPLQILKKKMITLGMNVIYTISDDLCELLLSHINKLKAHSQLHMTHFLDRLQYIFIRNCDKFIIDNEFLRLKNDKAILYYKKFYENRNKPLKEKILREVSYFKYRTTHDDGWLYIGNSYGEAPPPSSSPLSDSRYNKVYIDLKTKSKKELINLAIVKQKMEEDFISFKLHMFFQIMYEYKILNREEYYEIIYGTTNQRKIDLIKTGLTLNLVNRLEKDDQLKNISFDKYGNIATNAQYKRYKQSIDDFLRFELDRFL